MKNKIFNNLVNLASPLIGTETIEVNDEFFAPLERLIFDKEAIFIPDKYDGHGPLSWI